jgi:RNA-dependent RNA polymerase
MQKILVTEVEELRKRIIPDPSKFKNAAKYMSRLGLFCTSDRPSQEIPTEDFEEIPDLAAKDGALVTDGAGYIRLSLATQLFDHLEEPRPVSSAFQFRCRGLKGVLVVLPDEHTVFEGHRGKILYRPSQEKFASVHTVMGIVKEAKVHRVTLNRESINLLESLYLSRKAKEQWNLPNVLVEKQEAFLEEAALFLEYSTDAARELSKFVEPKELERIKAAFDLVTEPHFFRLLRSCHRIGVSDLCKRANLPIKDGCLVLGIPDYSGRLATDQIFLKIPADEANSGGVDRVILGPVIIYRNPCLHPGDIRLVTAVDVPELHLTPSVVVLPAETADYSLAASCSGGDLDGDQFSVIWDAELVPPAHLCQQPCDYDALPGRVS